MINSQNKHGPRYGPVLGNSSNRGSPPGGGIIPKGIPLAVSAAPGTAVTPPLFIVKPPGQETFKTPKKWSWEGIVREFTVVTRKKEKGKRKK